LFFFSLLLLSLLFSDFSFTKNSNNAPLLLPIRMQCLPCIPQTLKPDHVTCFSFSIYYSFIYFMLVLNFKIKISFLILFYFHCFNFLYYSILLFVKKVYEQLPFLKKIFLHIGICWTVHIYAYFSKKNTKLIM